MIHPIFTKLATQPGLFADHLAAYAELAHAELRQWGTDWLKRSLWAAVSIAATLLALGTSAVAAMLVATHGWHGLVAPWALVAVPGLFWAVALVCGLVAWRMKTEPAFALMREQVEADVALLNAAGRR